MRKLTERWKQRRQIQQTQSLGNGFQKGLSNSTRAAVTGIPSEKSLENFLEDNEVVESTPRKSKQKAKIYHGRQSHSNQPSEQQRQNEKINIQSDDRIDHKIQTGNDGAQFCKNHVVIEDTKTPCTTTVTDNQSNSLGFSLEWDNDALMAVDQLEEVEKQKKADEPPSKPGAHRESFSFFSPLPDNNVAARDKISTPIDVTDSLSPGFIQDIISPVFANNSENKSTSGLNQFLFSSGDEADQATKIQQMKSASSEAVTSEGFHVKSSNIRSVNDDRTGSSDGVTEKNVSNDSQDNLNPLALSCWGLPPSVLEKYKNAGIKEMFPWQAECLMTGKVLQGGNLVYSAPTSAGKTLVAELLMLKRVLETKRKAIYILPFVSVAREKMYHLQNLFQEAGVRVDGYMGSQAPSGGFVTTDIAICTIEKANSLVNRLMEEKKINNLGVVVVDEMHMIGDEHRGYLLELMLTKIKFLTETTKVEGDKICDSLQIIGMSATLPNIDMLAGWLQADLYLTDFRPVPLTELIKVGSSIMDIDKKKLRQIDTADIVSGDEEHIIPLCLQTIREKNSVLIFCPTKAWCEKLSEILAKNLRNSSPPTSKVSPSGFVKASQLVLFDDNGLSEVMEQLRRCPVGLDPVLAKVIVNAVAFHHAGLTFDERDVIEGAFRRGVIKVLVATSTLSSGVNLPARRVIIRTPMFHRKLLDPLVYKQMAGRAGRKGVDSEGESILVCKPSEKQKGLRLLKSHLEPVYSCLLASSDDDGVPSMKRALLEIIATGVATTPNDVRRYASSTFLHVCLSARNENSSEATITSTIKFLLDNEFIILQKNSGLDPSKDDNANKELKEKYLPTQLGSATLASALSPDEALAVFRELQKARRCFVLENELHIIYQVTPIYLQSQWPDLDWYHYFKIWDCLPRHLKHVGELVGVEEGFLARAVRGRIQKRTEEQKRVIAIHQRFYAALVLQELVNEVPINVVSRRYGVNRGLLQMLQGSASTFAGMVTVFCQKLGWNNLELLLEQFQSRLSFGVGRELCDLVRISLLNGARARLLYNSGYHTISALASAASGDIATILRNFAPFESRKNINGETKREIMLRSKARCIWVTGKEGLTEEDAAILIIEEAKRILKDDISLLGIHLNLSHNAMSKKMISGNEKSSYTSHSEQSADNSDRKIGLRGRKTYRKGTSGKRKSLEENPFRTPAKRRSPSQSMCDPKSTAEIIGGSFIKSPVEHNGPNILKDNGRNCLYVENDSQKRVSPSCNSSSLSTSSKVKQNNVSKRGRVPMNEKNTNVDVIEKENLISGEGLKKPANVEQNLPLEINASDRKTVKFETIQVNANGEENYLDQTSPQNITANDLDGSMPLIDSKDMDSLELDEKADVNLKPNVTPELYSEPIYDNVTDKPLEICRFAVNEDNLERDRNNKVEMNADDNDKNQCDKLNSRKECHPEKCEAISNQNGDPIDPAQLLAKDSFSLNLSLSSADFSVDIMGTGQPLDLQDAKPQEEEISEGTRKSSQSKCGTAAKESTENVRNALEIDQQTLSVAKILTPRKKLESFDLVSPITNSLASALTDIKDSEEGCFTKISEKPKKSTNAQEPLKSPSHNADASLPSDEFLIIDVAADKNLFETFINEWKTKTSYSIALACESVQTSDTIRIGDKVSGKRQHKDMRASNGIIVNGTDYSVMGLAVCWGEKDAYYVSLENQKMDSGICNPDDSLLPPPIADGLKVSDRLLAVKAVIEENSTEVKKVAFDVKSHHKVFRQFCRISLEGQLCDPKIASWLLDPGAKERTFHGLVMNYLSEKIQELISDIGGGFGVSGLGLTVKSPGPGRVRACVEAVLVYELMSVLEQRLVSENLIQPFKEIEMPCLITLAQLELNGIGFSDRECERLKSILKGKLRTLEEECYRLAGHPFSLTSPEDVAQVLYIELKLPPDGDPTKSRDSRPKGNTNRNTRGKLKHLSTAKGILEKLKNLHPLPMLILEWRRINSALTKVVFPLQREKKYCLISKMDRVFPECQIHTATGRVSFTEPNIQNVPKDFDINLPTMIGESPPQGNDSKTKRGTRMRSRLGRMGSSRCSSVRRKETMDNPAVDAMFSVSMRTSFVPYEGGLLVAADYSQLELRLIAHLANDKRLQNILNANGDVFKIIAAEMYSSTPEQISTKERQCAKQICYGIIYGIGSKALGQQLCVMEDDAAVYMETFKTRYKGIKAYVRETIAFAKSNGFVKTITGRKRYLPAINSTNTHGRNQAERQAVNTTVQGSAADLVKKAMVNIDTKLKFFYDAGHQSSSNAKSNMDKPCNYDDNSIPMKECLIPKSRLVLQLHDELLYEIPKNDLDNVLAIVKKEMENAMKLTVALPVKVKAGPSWGALEDIKLN